MFRKKKDQELAVIDQNKDIAEIQTTLSILYSRLGGSVSLSDFKTIVESLSGISKHKNSRVSPVGLPFIVDIDKKGNVSIKELEQ